MMKPAWSGRKLAGNNPGIAFHPQEKLLHGDAGLSS
jgi:hypothetical protein